MADPASISASKSTRSRRGFFLGAAAAAGATAVAVTAVPALRSAVPDSPTEDLPLPERGGGYSLSEHVKRYYRSARL